MFRILFFIILGYSVLATAGAVWSGRNSIEEHRTAKAYVEKADAQLALLKEEKQKAIDEATAKINALQAEKEKQLDESNSKIADLEAQLPKLNAKITELTEAESKKQTNANEDLAKAIKDNQTLKDRLDEVNKTSAQMETQLKANATLIQSLQEAVTSLKKKNTFSVSSQP